MLHYAVQVLCTNQSRTGRFKVWEFKQTGLTFGVVAGLEHMQLMGVVGEGEDFDHWVQDHHNPENKAEPTRRLKLNEMSKNLLK